MLRGVQVFVTPNTLTEVSNLLMMKQGDQRLLKALGLIIGKSREITVISQTAARNQHFLRLGLTDAALLEVISADRPLITVDLDLYTAAFDKGEIAAINFNHPTEP